MKQPDDGVAGRRRARGGARRPRHGRSARRRPRRRHPRDRRLLLHQSFMMNVGDEKGEILDAAIRRVQPAPAARAGHLLRLQRAAHGSRDAGRRAPRLDRVQRRQRRDRPAHLGPRGVGDRLTVVVGTLGDGGETIARARVRAWLRRRARWTSSSSTTTRTPTCPTSSASSSRAGCTPAPSWSPTTSSSPAHPTTASTCRREEGATWRTTEHDTHVEYQSLIKDLVLESEYLG